MQAVQRGPALTVPPSTYIVGGQCFETASRGFADAIAAAHAAHQRPRCMCLVDGVEMYVARLGDGFIVKRMPNTGSHHAPDCPSYEPPPEFSGLEQLFGSAINEDPATGETALKLGFSMSRIGHRSTVPTASSASDSLAPNGTKLSLLGLLHYLWDQAELTRWRPGFAGKRTWFTVRKHLLMAVENKIARGGALQERLYIPEVFSVDRRDAINARRIAQWAHAAVAPGKRQRLMLLIAEVKEIVPARFGFKAILKHVPDQAFAFDEQLYRRLARRFESELSLWGAADSVHMIMIATIGVSVAGVPSVEELSLMPVNHQWLPIEDSFELELIGRLVANERSFFKALRYSLNSSRQVASAILTDAGDIPFPLFIASHSTSTRCSQVESRDPVGEFNPGWVWETRLGEMPPLPRVFNTLARGARSTCTA